MLLSLFFRKKYPLGRVFLKLQKIILWQSFGGFLQKYMQNNLFYTLQYSFFVFSHKNVVPKLVNLILLNFFT